MEVREYRYKDQKKNTPYESIYGVNLREAVEGRQEELYYTLKPGSELLIKILEINFEYSSSILGGKGGIKAIFTAKVSTAYARDCDKYKEYINCRDLWIFATKEDAKREGITKFS